MNRAGTTIRVAAVGIAVVVMLFACGAALSSRGQQSEVRTGSVTVHRATKFDMSPPLRSLRGSGTTEEAPDCEGAGCGTSPEDPDEAADQEQKPVEVAPALIVLSVRVCSMNFGKSCGVVLATR